MASYKNPNSSGGGRGGYQNRAPSPAKSNPSGAPKPGYAPKGGARTPPSGGGGGGKGRTPDYEIFLGEVTTDEQGKKRTRVLEHEVDGRKKWAKVGAIWIDQSGRGLPPLIRFEQSIEAGTELVVKDYYQPGSGRQ